MEKHWASVLVILVILVAVAANSNIFRERLQGGPDGMCITSTEASPHGTGKNSAAELAEICRNALCWNSLARIFWSNIPANKVKQCQTYQCSANLISANQHGDSTWQHWKNKTPLWGFVVHIFLCSSWRHKHMMGHRIQSTQCRKSRCWFTKGRLKHTERWSQGHIMGAACYEDVSVVQQEGWWSATHVWRERGHSQWKQSVERKILGPLSTVHQFIKNYQEQLGLACGEHWKFDDIIFSIAGRSPNYGNFIGFNPPQIVLKNPRFKLDLAVYTVGRMVVNVTKNPTAFAPDVPMDGKWVSRLSSRMKNQLHCFIKIALSTNCYKHQNWNCCAMLCLSFLARIVQHYHFDQDLSSPPAVGKAGHLGTKHILPSWNVDRSSAKSSFQVHTRIS